jgi:hypothetical protein
LRKRVCNWQVDGGGLKRRKKGRLSHLLRGPEVAIGQFLSFSVKSRNTRSVLPSLTAFSSRIAPKHSEKGEASKLHGATLVLEDNQLSLRAKLVFPSTGRGGDVKGA